MYIRNLSASQDLEHSVSIRIRNRFIVILAGNLILLGLIAVNVQSLLNPLAIFRIALGLVYVFFIPGYLLQQVLFPGKAELDNIERAALSFALSGVIVPPIFLILNWLPWGIHMWPVVISFSLLIPVCLVIIAIRQRKFPNEVDMHSAKFSFPAWWKSLDHTTHRIYIALAAVLTVAFLTGFSILVTPKPAQFFTEFYMLGPEGRAENFPRQANMGQSLSVSLGVTNRERASTQYRVEVWQVDPVDGTHRQLVGEAPLFAIPVGETSQWDQTWQPAWPGQDQQFEFLLYTANDPVPYRQLLLWMNIVP
jgi:uncharacterized membrane protein